MSNQESVWIPGVVHVVLKEGVSPEDFVAALSGSNENVRPDKAFIGLDGIITEHGLLRYEASFSFTPPGLPAEVAPPPGRDRYFTLYFREEENVRSIADELSNLKQVEFASPAPRIAPPSSPLEEPLVRGEVDDLNSQWYIQRCQIDSAWTLKGNGKFFSGAGVVVADIDWGYHISHQEFKDRIEKRYNSINGSHFVGDGNLIAHGTAVLGMLGAACDGSKMIGVAYGSSLWAIQAGDGDPHITDFRFWSFAIDYVRMASSAGRRKVICLEAQTTKDLNIETDIIINKAIRDAIASGVVVCVPAGNGEKDAGLDADGKSVPETNSILVGATLFNEDATINEKAKLSNWGCRVVVSAPGDETNDVTCGVNADDDYTNSFGRTSGATPKVAGSVALMLEANPELSNTDIRSILNATGTAVANAGSKPVGTFLNAQAAVKEAQYRNAENLKHSRAESRVVMT